MGHGMSTVRVRKGSLNIQLVKTDFKAPDLKDRTAVKS